MNFDRSETLVPNDRIATSLEECDYLVLIIGTAKLVGNYTGGRATGYSVNYYIRIIDLNEMIIYRDIHFLTVEPPRTISDVHTGNVYGNFNEAHFRDKLAELLK
jgi:hypothetical protein